MVKRRIDQRLIAQQSLTMIELNLLPGDVLRTPWLYTSLVGKTRDRRFNPVDWMYLTRSALKYDEAVKKISFPSRWSLLPDKCESVGDYWKADPWLPEIRNIKDTSMESDFSGMATKDSINRAFRISMQYDTFRRVYRKDPFIVKFAVEGEKVMIHFNETARYQAMLPLEQYFSTEYRGTPTETGLSFLPVGLMYNKKRPTLVGKMPGYLGMWKMISNHSFVPNKYIGWALMECFAAFCLVTGDKREVVKPFENNRPDNMYNAGDIKIIKPKAPDYEELLMRFSMAVDWAIDNGLDSGSWNEFVSIFPMLNRYLAYPSLSSFLVEFTNDKDIKVSEYKRGTLGDWIYALYLFVRYLRKLKESGFEGFHRDVAFEYQGQAIPAKDIVESCFNVEHRLVKPGGKLEDTNPYVPVIAGPRDIFYIVKDSGVLTGAGTPKLCICLRDYTATAAKANNWHLIRPKDPLVLDTDYVDVTSETPIVPDLGKLNIDAYLVNLNSNLRVGTSKSLYRTDLEDDELVLSIIRGNAAYPSLQFDILESLMAGGLPYYTIDSYLPNATQVWDTLLPVMDQFASETTKDTRAKKPVAPHDYADDESAAILEEDTDENEQIAMEAYAAFIKDIADKTKVTEEEEAIAKEDATNGK